VKNVCDPLISLTMEDMVMDSVAERWITERRAATRERITCTRKRRFSKREAMTAIKRPVRRNKTRYRLRAYQCPYCNFWHLATDDSE